MPERKQNKNSADRDPWREECLECRSMIVKELNIGFEQNNRSVAHGKLYIGMVVSRREDGNIMTSTFEHEVEC